MAPRTRTIEEVGEDLDEIKATLADMSKQLEQKFLPRELYEAKHAALRHEVAAELASLRRDQAATEGVAGSARTLAQWCFGIIGIAVIAAMIGFVVAAAGGPPA